MDVGYGPAFSISRNGHVAYRSGTAVESHLIWFDRTGKRLNVASAPDANSVGFPELSPDERRVVLYRAVSGNFDVWLLDLVRGSMSRLTNEPTNDGLGIWSPDGTQIVYISNPKGVFDLYIKPSSGTVAAKPLLETPYVKIAEDWSTNGFLAYFEVNPKTGRDLWVVDMTSTDRKPRLVADTPYDETMAEFSPDGRWLAYQTNETGRFEIVVEPFPGLTSKTQVSTNGGIAPRWRADGKEIYFIAPNGKLMAVPTSSSGSLFDAGTPTELFQTGIISTVSVAQLTRPQYAVSRDGRFLINENLEQSKTFPITLILNWNPERSRQD